VEAVRPSLYMRAAPIGTPDLWVLAATSRVVRLVPIRMLSAQDRRTLPEESVLLNLIELGHFDQRCAPTSSVATRPSIPLQSEVILLLSWSVLPTIAKLDSLARRSSNDVRSPDADWLTTWHHFVETDYASSVAVLRTMTRRAGALDVLLAPRPRQYVLGTVCGDWQRDRTDGRESSRVQSRLAPDRDRCVTANSHEPNVREMASPNPWSTSESCPLCVGDHHAVR
jgi:hypothetical protein